MSRGRRVTSMPVDPRHDHVRVRASRAGWGAEAFPLPSVSVMSKAPPFVSPMKDIAEIRRKRLWPSWCRLWLVRFAWIACHRLAVQDRSACRHRRRTRPWRHGRWHHRESNPGRFRRRKCRPSSLIRSSTFRFAPPRIPCVASKPARSALAVLDLPPGLLEPVAAKVGLTRNTVAPDAEHRVHVFVAQVRPQQLSAQKRRVAHDELRLRPLRLLRMLRVGKVQDRVHLPDRLDGRQHRMVGHLEAVVVHPLQIADPDHDLGKLLGVGVDLQPVKLRGIHLRERATGPASAA